MELDLTNTQILWIVVAVLVVLVVLALIVTMTKKRKRTQREKLRDRYGPEYERTVAVTGSESAAAADLEERERLHERYRLRDLDESERADAGRRLAELQYRFVEDPSGAMYELSRVGADTLRQRGYPVAEDRELALRLFGMDHPEHAQPMRDAIEARSGGSLEDLRIRFVAVRDALRESAGVHYGADDAVAGGWRDASADRTGRSEADERSRGRQGGGPPGPEQAEQEHEPSLAQREQEPTRPVATVPAPSDAGPDRASGTQADQGGDRGETPAASPSDRDAPPLTSPVAAPGPEERPSTGSTLPPDEPERSDDRTDSTDRHERRERDRSGGAVAAGEAERRDQDEGRTP